jgi:outer membrane protein OmpA-like peptidoglycan-associated protein
MKAKSIILLISFFLFYVCTIANDTAKAVHEPGIYKAEVRNTNKAGLRVYGPAFPKNSAVITAEASEKLDEIIKMLDGYFDDNGIPSIQIDGYTDSLGSAKHNLKLSQTRAESIKKYILNKFKDKGLKESNFTVKGRGATKFIADNATSEGRSQNRRIEITIIRKSSSAKAITGKDKNAEKQEQTEIVKATATVEAVKTKPAVVKTKTAMTAAANKNNGCLGCIGLLSADAVLTAYAVYAVLDQWKAVDDYNGKYNTLDNIHGSNYDQLNSIKKDAEKKNTPVAAGVCLAGAAVAYTIADYFWLHNIFPVDIRSGVLADSRGIHGITFALKEPF